MSLLYVVLPKISENLNMPRKPLVLQTCAARCVWLYLSNFSQTTGVCISARVSEFWLFLYTALCVSAIIETADVNEQKFCIKFYF